MKITPAVSADSETAQHNVRDQGIAEPMHEDDPVEAEMVERTVIAEKRYEAYKSILHNQNTDTIPSFVGFYPLGGVVLGILAIVPATRVPIHDVIKHPEHYVETASTKFLTLPIVITYFIFSCSYWMNTKCLLTPKNFSITFLLLIPCTILPGSVSNAIWMKRLNYNFPVPFITLIQSPLIIPLSSLATWYQFPKQYRNSKLFQGRFRCFVATYWGITFMNIEYAVLGKLIITIPER